MEHRGEMTKALLGAKFKELIIKKPFDKITIKMITDAAGVIRPTFYNYFQDKYEVMEWLLWEDVFKSVTELVKMDMARAAIEMLFRKIDADKNYYRKTFEVEGQNSFEEMFYEQVYRVVKIVIDKHPMKLKGVSPVINKEILLKFQAMTLVNGIKYWVIYDMDISADEALNFYEFLMSHSILEIIGDDVLDKVIN